MFLIFRIITLCIFAIYCYECNEPEVPQYVLAKGYFGNVIKGNFFFAYEYCRSVGMKVATPNTKEKNDALLKFIKDIGSIWTSGNDLANEGRFLWMVDGTLLTYTDWAENQPADAGGENCLEIRQEFDFKWNDLPCHIKYPVVCEIEKREAIKC